ncbi:MAG: tetratricopeptide repeat protein [Gemmatimonadota bacterium]|nr:tetratricopeptide repeat protein [Gemmatimonadota bacterium]
MKFVTSRFVITALFISGASGIASYRAHSAKASAPSASRRVDAEIRDKDIAFYLARAERDPTGAFDLAQLAKLYSDRARETGSYQDVLRAEEVARKSLAHRTSHNDRALQLLATSLLSQHRFAEARDAARTLLARDSARVSYRAMLAEIEMELGDYDSARVRFASLNGERTNLSVAPRLARWIEIEGSPEQSRRLLDNGLTQALDRQDLPREQIAWYWLRLGDVKLRTGKAGDAATAYHEGLEAAPDDYRLLAALAHLELVRGKPSRAIEYGERAIAILPDPGTLGLLSDAYAATGDSAKSADYAKTLEVVVAGQPGAYHRAWSLFLLDHDRRTAEVLAKTQNELTTRKDIYGYDLLAWALHKQGRDAEAATAMTNALSQHTKDAMLYYHAGMIERSLGRQREAYWYLSHALSTNPYFHPTQPTIARATLDSLAKALKQ